MTNDERNFCALSFIEFAPFIRHSVIRHSSFRAGGAFTLIELIVTVTIIVILAGLVLSTVGYVQKKAARSRAETEIAAMSAACENYKAEMEFTRATRIRMVSTLRSLAIQTLRSIRGPAFISINVVWATNGNRTPDSGVEIIFRLQTKHAQPRRYKLRTCSSFEIPSKQLRLLDDSSSNR